MSTKDDARGSSAEEPGVASEPLRTIEEWGAITGLRVVDPDGFDRTDPELWTRRFTEAEFQRGAMMSSCADWNDRSFWPREEVTRIPGPDSVAHTFGSYRTIGVQDGPGARLGEIARQDRSSRGWGRLAEDLADYHRTPTFGGIIEEAERSVRENGWKRYDPGELEGGKEFYIQHSLRFESMTRREAWRRVPLWKKAAWRVGTWLDRFLTRGWR